MATHRRDVSVHFGVPDALEAAVGAAELPMVRVPDVRLCSEATAIARIAAAGLVPGQRDPRPRPVGGRSEVVIRTRPRHGSAVRRGTRVDYELAPGEPMGLPLAVVEHGLDAATSTSSAVSASPVWSRSASATGGAWEGYVDYDAVETIHAIVADEKAADLDE